VTAIILHALFVEGPREVVIGFACGVGVMLTLSFLAHHKLVKPARERHEELMAAHQAHAENLKQIRKQL
jgi:UDP-N-acetylglucosamine transferase subunit ALG13